jgi:hypothetical protein
MVGAGASGLGAPLTDDVRQWIADVWDATEAALLKARREGRQAAAELVQKVDALLKQAAVELVDRYRAVKDAIAARLSAYITSVIDAALLRVRPALSIGGREMLVSSVTIEQRLMLSGSVKASLEEIVEFIAEGELTLSAEYGLPRV